MDSYRPRERETYDDDRPASRGYQHNAGHSRRHEREYWDFDGPSYGSKDHRRPTLDYDDDQGFSIKGAGDRLDDDAEIRKQQNIQQDSVGGSPSKLLIMIGLPASATKHHVATAIKKLEPAEAAGGIRRILLIRDRKTQNSMGYAFAEFHTVEAAKATLEQYESQENFTIEGNPVHVKFPHLYVFQPVTIDNFYTPGQYTFVMPHDCQKYRYRDQYSFAEELMICENPPAAKRSADAPLEDSKKTKKAKTEKKVKSGSALAAPKELQKWQARGRELRAEDPAAEMKAKSLPLSGVNAIKTSTGRSPAVQNASKLPALSDEQTFCIDTENSKCCYLCYVNLATSDKLQKHATLSAKHKDNLNDEDAKKMGYERLKKKGIDKNSTLKLPAATNRQAKMKAQSVEKSTEEAVSETAYRDRAAERRAEQAPSAAAPSGFKMSLKSASAKETKASAMGKGASLLAKAGGSAPSTASPLAQQVLDQGLYRGGVGLGHESSRVGDAVEEAERMTQAEGSGDGRAGFLEKTREVARARYQSMK